MTGTWLEHIYNNTNDKNMKIKLSRHANKSVVKSQIVCQIEQKTDIPGNKKVINHTIISHCSGTTYISLSDL